MYPDPSDSGGQLILSLAGRFTGKAAHTQVGMELEPLHLNPRSVVLDKTKKIPYSSL